MINNTFTKLPTHLGIILDGNGRYAIKKGMPRTFGHKKGIETLKKIVQEVNNLGIKFLSIYTFSCDNFKRPKEEVDFLMNEAKTLFNSLIEKPQFNVRVIGERSGLSKDMLDMIDKINCRRFDENQFTLFVAFNYSSKLEIVNATCKMKELKLAFTKDNFEKCLYTYPAPPIDLLIRTSHEQRLSDFMLYQASYAELYFPKTLWPEFSKRALYKALEEYQNRDRRFGKI